MTRDEYLYLGKGAVVCHVKTGEQHTLKTRRMGGWQTTQHSRKPGKGGIFIDNYDMQSDYEVVSMDGAYMVSDLHAETLYQIAQRKAAQKQLK